MQQCTIVISTANERINSLRLKPYHKDIEYVVVHQVYDKYEQNITLPDCTLRDDVTYIRLDYPGLSISRNTGLISATTKYAYVMDDDVEFDPESIMYLVNWMEENHVDVATCQFEFNNGSYPRNYKKIPFKHNMLSSAKISSIEICLNIEKNREKKIFFDERFGLGTDLPSGEEYIFVTDCIKSDLAVWFYPIVCGVHPNITSGMDFYTSANKTLAKREMLKRIFGRKALVFIFAFWLKKIPIVTRAGFLWPFTKRMILGIK